MPVFSCSSSRKGLTKRIDRRQRAGGFAGGEDDEILVVLVVVLELQFIVIVIFIAASVTATAALSPTARSVGRRANGKFPSSSGATASSAAAGN